MVRRVCDECETAYEAKQSNSRFCRDACRKKASRSKAAASRVAAELPDVPDAGNESRDEDAKLIEATEAALLLAGQLDSVLGQIAMTLARDLARARYGAGAHASLAKELRLVIAEIAPAKPKTEGTRLDEVRGKGASRRTNPAGLHIVS